jgi:hypothetical protein
LPNLARNLVATGPNQLWVCDILPHQVPNEHVENRHPKASTPEEAPPLTH